MSAATDTRVRDVAALAHTHVLHRVMSEDDIEALRERNAIRLRTEQERLGERWVLAGTRRAPIGAPKGIVETWSDSDLVACLEDAHRAIAERAPLLWDAQAIKPGAGREFP